MGWLDMVVEAEKGAQSVEERGAERQCGLAPSSGREPARDERVRHAAPELAAWMLRIALLLAYLDAVGHRLLELLEERVVGDAELLEQVEHELVLAGQARRPLRQRPQPREHEHRQHGPALVHEVAQLRERAL